MNAAGDEKCESYTIFKVISVHQKINVPPNAIHCTSILPLCMTIHTINIILDT